MALILGFAIYIPGCRTIQGHIFWLGSTEHQGSYHSSVTSLTSLLPVMKTWEVEIYCDVSGSPCLSKMDPVYGPFFFFQNFWIVLLVSLSRYLVHLWTDQRIPGPVSCRWARVVCWRPHPAGTWQYCDVPGSSCLSKTSSVYGPSF